MMLRTKAVGRPSRSNMLGDILAVTDDSERNIGSATKRCWDRPGVPACDAKPEGARPHTWATVIGTASIAAGECVKSKSTRQCTTKCEAVAL